MATLVAGSTAIRWVPPTGAAVLIAVSASLGVVDVDVPAIGWDGQSLGPTSRLLIVGALWTGAVVLGMITVTKLNRRELLLLGPIVAMILWAGLSSAVGIVPARSLLIWLGLCASALVSLALVRSGAKVAIAALTVASGALVYASLLARVLGEGQIDGRLRGITLEPNIIGQLAGLFVVCGILLASFGRLRLAIVLAVFPAGLATIYLSETRTAILAVGLSVVALVVRSNPKASIAALLLSAALMAMFVSSSDLTDATRRNESEELSNLSGRLQIWTYSIDQIRQRPLLGAGLASGVTQFKSESTESGLVTATSSHSLPLEIARETGLIGVGFALLAVTVARPWAHRRAAPLFVYLLVTGLTMPSSGLPGIITLAWFVVLAIGVLSPDASSPHAHANAPLLTASQPSLNAAQSGS